MGKLLSVSLAVVLFAGGTAAFANGIVFEGDNPPPWRDELSTTSQVWHLETDYRGPIFPDGPAFGGKPPLYNTHLSVELGSWSSEYLGHQGVWHLDGAAHINVVVANHRPPNDYKLLRLQLVWVGSSLPSTHLRLLTDFGASGPDGPYDHTDPVVIADSIRPSPTPSDPWWHHTTYEWEIYPNPVDEWFIIGLNPDVQASVDALLIDTWCIPEAATLAVLFLGGLAVLRRRRLG